MTQAQIGPELCFHSYIFLSDHIYFHESKTKAALKISHVTFIKREKYLVAYHF